MVAVIEKVVGIVAETTVVFEGGREEFLNRFDTDGDGEISESEREAIREHFRGGGGQRGGSGGQGGGQGASNGNRGGSSRNGDSRGGGQPN